WAYPGFLAQHLAETIAVATLPEEVLRHYTVEAWKPGSRYKYTDEPWLNVWVTTDRWARSGIFQSKPETTDMDQAERLFLSGKAGMVSGPGGGFASLEKGKFQGSANRSSTGCYFPPSLGQHAAACMPGRACSFRRQRHI
ncbi:MAG TPA: hypothetical protein VLJ88_19300, partial [Propionibacteriaceae bacterium]|nr:hypothetical protein [Propionibacteriaceae bacterium]